MSKLYLKILKPKSTHRSPGVSKNPVVNSVLRSPTNDGHSVRNVRRTGVKVSQDTRLVVLEDVKVSKDVHGNGTMVLDDRHNGVIRGVQC